MIFCSLPVQRVPPLGPLVEVDAGLEEGGGAEEEAPQLDEAPVPAERLLCNLEDNSHKSYCNL